MENIAIRSLEGVEFDVIADAFAGAFADYAVSFPKEALRAMFVRRGFDPSLSFGAWVEGRLVAFIFNGAGEWGGLPTVYDTGTGTLPEYRGQRIVGRIFEHSLPLLREAGIRQYLLEVLKNNDKAVRIYEGCGFEVSRHFDCYHWTASDVSATGGDCSLPSGYTMHEVNPLDFPQCDSFVDFTPSWQNSSDSIRRSASTLVSYAVFFDGKPVGKIVFELSTGDIPFLVVAPSHRRKGIASRLLSEVVDRFSPASMKVINVESSCLSLPSFLMSRDFSAGLSQFQMLRSLQ